MEYTLFGRTGLEVSRICFGCMSFGTPDQKRGWTLTDDDARPIFRAAWEAGINFYDTADIYAFGTSEEVTGRMLRELGKREDYVLATKIYNRMAPGPNRAGLSRKAIMAGIDASLKRLGTDYVDLYQIHRFDWHTPIEETLEALNDIVRAGKVRYIGASSMYAWQFAKMLFTSEKHGWARFISMQCEVSLAMRSEEVEMIPLCRDQGVAVMPWSPLGGGKLTRPWGTETRRTETDVFQRGTLYADAELGEKAVVDEVERIAKARGVPMATVAMAWLLHKPGISAPIIGATRQNHVKDAAAAVTFLLEPDEIVALERVYVQRPSPAYLSPRPEGEDPRRWHG